jgi:hypothetical protein
VGLAQRDFEISVNYAKERVQFGRPIGSFQAIQHKAADMVTDVDGMRFIMYKAAWATSENEASADMDVAMAKAWCSDASRRVVAHGQQIHGGIGFTKDYVIQLFFRRQKRAELFWGDADFHRERVAQMLRSIRAAFTKRGPRIWTPLLFVPELPERALRRRSPLNAETARTAPLCTWWPYQYVIVGVQDGLLPQIAAIAREGNTWYGLVSGCDGSVRLALGWLPAAAETMTTTGEAAAVAGTGSDGK